VSSAAGDAKRCREIDFYRAKYRPPACPFWEGLGLLATISEGGGGGKNNLPERPMSLLKVGFILREKNGFRVGKRIKWLPGSLGQIRPLVLQYIREGLSGFCKES